MVVVKLKTGVTIHKIREILSRVGIGNNVTNVLYPTCYCFTIGTKVYISHFKELLALEKDPDLFKESKSDITEEDLNRRDNIVELLEDWGLISIVSSNIKNKPKQNFKILKVYEKNSKWTIKHKYTI